MQVMAEQCKKLGPNLVWSWYSLLKIYWEYIPWNMVGIDIIIVYPIKYVQGCVVFGMLW